ncbi:Gfo/Idh/MocA family protein [Deinococcus maricopensis]|uniref:Oxidoreductase domain protein n=1 Tax=Deinococcus maricopensis (strain DSM 21211 / LMG 22137 / NRRL B-23946 / LB-34) TaxID=709986 RepID=E8U3G7_DEIML|nr:Gfo/Idh/MocA family oxidoreductase [Deinococcus maricopensis]ADV65838.1 oxidoreductase domain protein [Deinococcus maricopensis DSM 21211]
MTAAPLRIGVVGVGNISPIYLSAPRTFPALTITAVSDLDLERARARADEFGVPRALPLGDLLRDDDVDVILNLTIPAAHAEVALAAVEAGKHVYNEKPLSIDLEAGRTLLARAHERGVRVGCAPDTFLGGGLQTARKALDDGLIGEPVAATAFMLGHGPESWHPNPDFFYQPGAGPMFDMGPYYLTALVNMLGPVRRVSSSARASFAERIAGAGDAPGRRIPVRTPTHIASVLDFEAGPIATLVTSFDVWAADVPRLEIYGTEGTLSLPDPNTFGGPVRVRRAGSDAWTDLPLTHPYAENSRGIGLADLAAALRTGRAHRASGELALHVLEVMHATLRASDLGRHIDIHARPPRPDALPQGHDEEVLA